MKSLFFLQQFPESLLRPTIDFILSVQCEDGRIPWQPGDKTDPWNHIEAAMGLSIGGEYGAANAAYEWLAKLQREDGSWFASYGEAAKVLEDKRETNFIAYIATGVWHHYLITGDENFLQRYFPVLERAINFVLRYQSDEGEIAWAVNKDGNARDDALVTACASIYKSIDCAIACANQLDIKKPHWEQAFERLGVALTDKPHRFDRNWESKARYSMDWFYPVLTGAFQGDAARARIAQRWNEFVIDELGCKCVSDEPWVTVAESCELTMALLAIGDKRRAAQIYSWLHQFKNEDGGYWTGFVYPDDALWPEERTSWTAGAVLLAADALSGYTNAADLFTNHGRELTNEQAAFAQAQQRRSGEAAQ
ncbi:MAG: prenyltransferase [Gammaproteobacteria bacterium]|nr:prenyltransferase [Gammaproteobacteria bacterium]NND38869.1 prenyltransferase [Pseudomonadales bacterium]NNL11943.1 prenyltransferase [Pseudomonadales bacterium]